MTRGLGGDVTTTALDAWFLLLVLLELTRLRRMTAPLALVGSCAATISFLAQMIDAFASLSALNPSPWEWRFMLHLADGMTYLAVAAFGVAVLSCLRALEVFWKIARQPESPEARP